MLNILFVSPADFSETAVPNGGTYCSKMHLDILSSLRDINLTVLSLSRNTQGKMKGITYIPATKNRWETLFRNLTGYSFCLTPEAEEIFFEHLKDGKFDVLFLDSSHFGRIAQKAKTLYPELKIISFFHNIEYIYALSQVRILGPQFFPKVICAWLNEKQAVRYSDILTAINERDKNIIEKKYGGHVSGIIYPWYNGGNLSNELLPISNPLEVLFMGAYTHHANIAGIAWFIEKVLPRTDIHLTIAGREMEKLRKIYPASNKLQIVGSVDNVECVYRNADCVVAPIFDGSGMKIKTGEALSYGKTVVGTSEAFMGYNITRGLEGYICETVNDFSRAFAEIAANQRSKTNIASYNYFKLYLSKEAAVKIFKDVLDLCYRKQ